MPLCAGAEKSDIPHSSVPLYRIYYITFKKSISDDCPPESPPPPGRIEVCIIITIKVIFGILGYTYIVAIIAGSYSVAVFVLVALNALLLLLIYKKKQTRTLTKFQVCCCDSVLI